MATDWEEDGPVEISQRLVGRAFSYFLPYWRRGVLSLLAIVLGAVLGLAPALIAKKLIDHLSAHDATFGYITLLVGLGFGAAKSRRSPFGIVSRAGSWAS